MKKPPRWLGKTVLLAIHERLLAEHGGLPGLLDEGRLESALASPVNHFAHGVTDIFRLAAAYAQALNRDHPFRDGNKRVALTACGVLLELNGFRLEASEQEAVSAMLALASRGIDEVGFATWLKDSCRKTRRRLKSSASSSPRRGRARY